MLGKRSPVDVTGVCDAWDQALSPSIKRWGVRLNYFNNFDSSGAGTTAGIYVALKAAFDSTASSGVALVIRKSTAIRSNSNPEWSGLVGVDGDFAIHAGALAEASKGSVTLKGMGTLSFLTSSS